MRPLAAFVGRHAPVVLLAFLVSCRSVPPAAPVTANPATDAPAVRFLLTFDDGPSIRQPVNPTLSIVDQLATNSLQPGIKAIFFVQTRHPRGGGTPQGREVMRRVAEAGHVLAIHSVSPRGHVDHTKTPTNELIASLKEAKAIIRQASGSEPLFVRPPFGAHTVRTRSIYASLGLHVLMADIRARDGVIYGYNGSFRRRSHIRDGLIAIKQDLDRHPAGDDPVTVILNFHDVNPYTARHMTEYLHILVEEAARVGFAIPAKPFFESKASIDDAAICRCVPEPPR